MSILSAVGIIYLIFMAGVVFGWAFRGMFEHTWDKEDERKRKNDANLLTRHNE